VLAIAVVRIENLVKNYGSVEAVRNVTLTCNDGEMMALLGPSGCGKTTILKMLAGIEDITSGELYFDDEPIGDRDPSARNIAMVFEDYALYPRLSVAQNIAFPLKIRRMPKSEIRPRLEKTLDMLDLQQFRNENVQRLSGGAQQRVSIGRALVRDPSLILFDEPLSHMDGDQKAQLRVEIKRLHHEMGLTSFLVTHDQTEAIAMCNRVAVLNFGVLQQVDTAQAVYGRPANLFVAAFVGEPPMNLLPAEIQEDNGALVASGAGWRVPLPGDVETVVRRAARLTSVIVGVRPEHLTLAEPNAAGEEEGVLPGVVYFRELRGDSEVILVSTDALGEPVKRESAADSGRIIIEVTGNTGLNEDELVALRIPPDRVHVFDAASGENLLGGRPCAASKT